MGEQLRTDTPERRAEAVDRAVAALQAGDLAVFPTDTVYGLGADAFSPAAVTKLLEAKGRGREMPPPVLVADTAAFGALTTDVPDWAKTLTVHFWPGALTLVCQAQQSLQWDLGETRGTVAVRVPDDGLAREILGRTGPLAVSSANLTGEAAATDADAAAVMLATKVEVIVDGGPRTSAGGASTIVDATGDVPRLLRPGAIPVEDLDRVLESFDVRVDVTGA